MKRNPASEIEKVKEHDTIDNHEHTSGFFTCDSTGNFTSVDEDFSRLFNYSKEELLSINLIELIHVDDLKRSFIIYEQFIKFKQIPDIITLKCARKDKSTFLADFHLSVIHEEDKAIGFKGFITEVIDESVKDTQKLSNHQIQDLTAVINHLNLGPKRTFTTIRNIILIFLSKGELSINEISQLSGINWKTVENHLTYLIGKKLVKENFSSRYVRLLTLTKRGEQHVLKLRDKLSNYFIDKTSEVKKV